MRYGLCQFGVYNRLREEPSLINKRVIAREEDDSVCDGALIDFLKENKKREQSLIIF